jgi:hypothetical protein
MARKKFFGSPVNQAMSYQVQDASLSRKSTKLITKYFKKLISLLARPEQGVKS